MECNIKRKNNVRLGGGVIPLAQWGSRSRNLSHRSWGKWRKGERREADTVKSKTDTIELILPARGFIKGEAIKRAKVLFLWLWHIVYLKVSWKLRGRGEKSICHTLLCIKVIAVTAFGGKTGCRQGLDSLTIANIHLGVFQFDGTATLRVSPCDFT